ncbi:MAG: hypothetical protein K0S07_1357 [Chlamydiales bacterium]|jgi:hypothetical protein|nr:hypothetical protein [Chlamydiales bacterium]
MSTKAESHSFKIDPTVQELVGDPSSFQGPPSEYMRLVKEFTEVQQRRQSVDLLYARAYKFLVSLQKKIANYQDKWQTNSDKTS